MDEFSQLDPVYAAWFYFRMGEYDSGASTATEMLKMDPEAKLPWAIKMVNLTENVKNLNEDESAELLGEELFAENQIQKTARPGTSLKAAINKKTDRFDPNGPAMRPQTGSRPLSGFARPGTSTRPTTGNAATLATPKTAARLGTGTARPVTGKNLRANLQTAQAYAQNENGNEPFLNISRLNLEKYAEDEIQSKILFEHIFNVHQDYRLALTLAENANSYSNENDSYWKMAMALCNLRLGMIRKAEEYAIDFTKATKLPSGAILLSHIYRKLDQPVAAAKTLSKCIRKHPNDILLLSNLARLDSLRGLHEESTKNYQKILELDPSNREALCIIAADQFYNNDPVQSFSYYRRSLQSGTVCAATYNNIGLAASAIGQIDLAFRCFQFGLKVAEDDEEIEMIWYNIGNVAMQIGEFQLARRCYKISVAAGDGGMALNNLGVLSALEEERILASSLFKQAEQAQMGWEALWNCALLAHEKGDEETAFEYLKKAIELNPDDKQSQDLFKHLSHKFRLI